MLRMRPRSRRDRPAGASRQRRSRRRDHEPADAARVGARRRARASASVRSAEDAGERGGDRSADAAVDCRRAQRPPTEANASDEGRDEVGNAVATGRGRSSVSSRRSSEHELEVEQGLEHRDATIVTSAKPTTTRRRARPVPPPCTQVYACIGVVSRVPRCSLRRPSRLPRSRSPSLYGWFEAGWLRTRVLEVPIDGLPEALDGLRIGHLSDFHLGAPLSLGNRASGRAVDWVAARRPDLVCVTGDLVSHPRGERRLRELLARLERPFVVLGNHDVAVTRDPFSRAAELRDLEQTLLLRDAVETVDIRGRARLRRRRRPRGVPRASVAAGRARRPDGGAAPPPVPLPVASSTGSRPARSTSSSPATSTPGRSASRSPGAPDHARAPDARGSSPASTGRRRRRCTSRRGRARRSSRSASSRGPR